MTRKEVRRIEPNGTLQIIDRLQLHVTFAGDEVWHPHPELPSLTIARLMKPDGATVFSIWVPIGSTSHRAMRLLRPEFGWAVVSQSRAGSRDHELFERPAPMEGV